MLSSNMSAGGESSSEKLTLPVPIVAHETEDDAASAILQTAWKEYDDLETARHRSRARDYAREKRVKADVVFDETEIADLVGLMTDFYLDGLYSVPAT